MAKKKKKETFMDRAMVEEIFEELKQPVGMEDLVFSAGIFNFLHKNIHAMLVSGMKAKKK